MDLIEGGGEEGGKVLMPWERKKKKNSLWWLWWEEMNKFSLRDEIIGIHKWQSNLSRSHVVSQAFAQNGFGSGFSHNIS